MSEQEVMDKIINLVADRFELEKEQIKSSTSFKDDLDADSIDLVEFVLELEDEFGNEISDDDAAEIKTVGEAAKYISSHQ